MSKKQKCRHKQINISLNIEGVRNEIVADLIHYLFFDLKDDLKRILDKSHCPVCGALGGGLDLAFKVDGISYKFSLTKVYENGETLAETDWRVLLNYCRKELFNITQDVEYLNAYIKDDEDFKKKKKDRKELERIMRMTTKLEHW